MHDIVLEPAASVGSGIPGGGGMLSKATNPLKQIGRTIRLVWQCSPGWSLAGTLLILGQSMVPVAGLYLTKLILDLLERLLLTDAPGAIPAELYVYIALAGAVAVIGRAMTALSTWVKDAQSYLATVFFHGKIHQKACEASLAWFERPDWADMLHRAQTEVGYRPTRIVSSLALLTQQFFSLAGIGVLVLAFNPTLCMIVVLATIPEFLVGFHWSRRIYEWERAKTQSERLSWFYHWLITNDESAHEIRAFNTGKYFSDKYQEIETNLFRQKNSLLRGRGFFESISGGFSALGLYCAYAWIVYMTAVRRISLGEMVMFFQALRQVQEYLQEAMGQAAALYEDNLFLTNLFQLLDLGGGMEPPALPLPVPRPMQQGIVVSNVEFSYPGSDQPAITGINLDIAPGRMIALVGQNGSGKTTLIKLLCRLYDPNSGSITVDGTDIRNFDPIIWRKELGVIFQDYSEYPFSAFDNVWLGDCGQPKDREATRQRFENACMRSGADSVIRNLPDGEDTVLSKWLDCGTELSQGQWQKIALARAFFRDSQVVILDEPTSSLDAKAEFEVFNTLRSVASDTSLVLISHRISNVRMADMIHVLEGGRIVESGNHDELMTLGGRYAELFEIQARPYFED